MKVEWLNDDMTHARVVIGWWRKHTAEVRRLSEEEWQQQAGSLWWRFVPSDRPVDFSIGRKLGARRSRILEVRRRAEDWQPVGALPRAEVRRCP